MKGGTRMMKSEGEINVHVSDMEGKIGNGRSSVSYTIALHS